MDMQWLCILLFYVGQSLLQITRTNCTDFCDTSLYYSNVYAASPFTLAPPQLMPEVQDSYSESSYSRAESLVIESEK